MSKPLEAVMVGAGDRGFRAQGMYALRFPHRLRYVAIAEPNELLRNRFGDAHAIPPERRYASWEDLLAAGQLAPALVNTTPDRVHMASSVAALDVGYHVLLEKPMATSPVECVRIVHAAERAGRIVQVFHCMRYMALFRLIHEVVASGRLGRIMSYTHIENVSYFLMSHAYVRGNWRRSDTSGPMILTKSCHDLDAIHWLVGSPSKRITSFGSLRHYRAENAQPDFPERCTDGCPIEDTCPWYAPRIYLPRDGVVPPLTPAITLDTSADGVVKALRTGPYGRCVYRCDNNVVDNQVVMIEMQDGTNVNFVMHGFCYDGGRTVRIEGTQATLHMEALKREVEVHDYLAGRTDLLHPGRTTGGHGGGDDGLMSAFIDAMQSGKQDVLTSVRASLESHLMAFAAEESRITGQVIDMDEYRQRIEKQAKEHS